MINETQLKRYCSEDISKIENYDLAINDDTQTWCCHHRLEIQGNVKRTARELSMCGLYWNRPADELILLTNSEHVRLHSIGNKYAKGKKSWLGRHHSIETRKKLSEKAKCRAPVSEETRKKMSIAHSGEKNHMFGKCGEKSHWFGKHHSEETLKKLSDVKIGRKWFTNGVDEICQYECPPGFVPGRAKYNKKAQ